MTVNGWRFVSLYDVTAVIWYLLNKDFLIANVFQLNRIKAWREIYAPRSDHKNDSISIGRTSNRSFIVAHFLIQSMHSVRSPIERRLKRD